VVKEAILHDIGAGFMLEDGQFDSTNLVSLEIEEMREKYRVCLVTPQEKRGLRLVSSFCDAVLDAILFSARYGVAIRWGREGPTETLTRHRAVPRSNRWRSFSCACARALRVSFGRARSARNPGPIVRYTR
jgi:hypothetical protein